MTKKKILRNTQRYALRDEERKIVYIGITNNVKRRLSEHKASGKKFATCSVSNKCTRASARKQEKELLERYERTHGRLPKYNRRK